MWTSYRWLVQIFEYIRDNPQLIVNGFHEARIPQAIDAFSAGDSDSDSLDSHNDWVDTVYTDDWVYHTWHDSYM